MTSIHSANCRRRRAADRGRFRRMVERSTGPNNAILEFADGKPQSIPAGYVVYFVQRYTTRGWAIFTTTKKRRRR